MEDQLSFFPATQLSPDNRLLFVALVPNDETAGEFYRLGGALRDSHYLPGKLRPLDHLHITLQELGGWSERTIRAASRACEATATHVAPVEVHLDRVMYWPSSRAYVLTETPNRNIPLREFRQRLGLELIRELGPKAFRSSFTPHLTLLYGARHIPEAPAPTMPWIARDIHLICSHQGDKKYDWLGQWPLLGEPKSDAIS